MDGSAGSESAGPTGDLLVEATISEARLWQEKSSPSAFLPEARLRGRCPHTRDVLGEGAFCKHCDKLGMAKGEWDGMLVMMMGLQCSHSRRRSAQHDCRSCS